jgi:uncharacterized integral membrane protein
VPWKFILFIIICILFSLFVSVNLDNKADVSFILVSFAKVPIFLVVLISFAAGACAGIFALVFTKSKKKKKQKIDMKKGKPREDAQEDAMEETHVGEKRHGRKRK